MNPYYSNKLISIYHGDCIEIMQNTFDNNVFDLVLTDLPYGKTANEWDNTIDFNVMWKSLKNITNQTTPILLFGSEPFASFLRCSNIKNYRYDWIYHKTHPTNFLNAKKQPLRNYETISVFMKNSVFIIRKWKKVSHMHMHLVKPVKQFLLILIFLIFLQKNNGTRYPVSITKAYSLEKEKFHPTQKPVALLEYLIKTYTNENDIVLDFTAGSGSTAIACINTNRQCVLIEKEEKYCKIAVERVKDSFTKNFYFV